MEILSSRRFGLWWSLAADWFTTKFGLLQAAVAQIDIRKSDIPTDYAKAGAVAKNLDDIHVDLGPIEEKLGEPTVSGDTLFDITEGINGKIGYLSDTVTGIEVSGKTGLFVFTSRKQIGQVTYSEFHGYEDPEVFVYTRATEPTPNTNVYEKSGESTMTKCGVVTVMHTESITSLLHGLAKAGATAKTLDDIQVDLTPIEEKIGEPSVSGDTVFAVSEGIAEKIGTAATGQANTLFTAIKENNEYLTNLVEGVYRATNTESNTYFNS